jgi:hypothetical protein
MVWAAHLGLQEGVLQEAALKPCPHPTPAPPMKRQHGEAGRGGTAGMALRRQYTREHDGGCPRPSVNVVGGPRTSCSREVSSKKPRPNHARIQPPSESEPPA